MGRDDPFDLEAKEERAELQQRATAKAESLERADWLELMGKDWGRRIVRRLLVQHFADVPVFNSNNSVMSQRAGMHDWATELRRRLERDCPQLVALSLTEAQAERDAGADERRNN